MTLQLKCLKEAIQMKGHNTCFEANSTDTIFNYHQILILTLKAPNKNCSRRHFNFLLLSFEENKA